MLPWLSAESGGPPSRKAQPRITEVSRKTRSIWFQVELLSCDVFYFEKWKVTPLIGSSCSTLLPSCLFVESVPSRLCFVPSYTLGFVEVLVRVTDKSQMYLRWTKAELHLRTKGQDRTIRRTADHTCTRGGRGAAQTTRNQAGPRREVECHFLRTGQTQLGATVTSSSHLSSFTYFEPERFQNQPNGSSKK